MRVVNEIWMLNLDDWNEAILISNIGDNLNETIGTNVAVGTDDLLERQFFCLVIDASEAFFVAILIIILDVAVDLKNLIIFFIKLGV
jgi:hypothetical protein